MAEKISWHPPDAALRPASQFECALRRRRKIGFCPPTARRLRVAMLALSARPSAAPLSSYRKVPRLGERAQEPRTTAYGPVLPPPACAGDGGCRWRVGGGCCYPFDRVSQGGVYRLRSPSAVVAMLRTSSYCLSWRCAFCCIASKAFWSAGASPSLLASPRSATCSS